MGTFEGDYPVENILFPREDELLFFAEGQYFDLFSPQEKEVFIDAGGYDGDTITALFDWLGDVEGKCYSLEPVPALYDMLVERSKKEKWKNVVLSNYAAWDKKEKVFLTIDRRENKNEGIQISGGSHIERNGKEPVEGRPIDIVYDKKDVITYIKMDVEGSELKALEGAKNTIIRYKPKLVISLYHHPIDVFEIPSYILSLVPEYKIYIRHYTSYEGETVLYAEG